MAAEASSQRVKVVLVGDPGVGKSSLFNRFQNKPFSLRQAQTIGGACASVTVALPDSAPANLMVWDTAGQERFRGIVPMYFSRAAFIIVVYDISARVSFDHLPEWVGLARQHAPECVKVILVGNKSDREDARAVPHLEGSRAAADMAAFSFLETSAMTDEGVQLLLHGIGSEAMRTASPIYGLGGPRESIISQSKLLAADKNRCCRQ
jgi:small GTP-binding protein